MLSYFEYLLSVNLNMEKLGPNLTLADQKVSNPRFIFVVHIALKIYRQEEDQEILRKLMVLTW